MTSDESRDRFLRDLALTVVTLGFYMPYWMWKRNDELRRTFLNITLHENAWLLSIGAAIALLARFVFGAVDDDWAAGWSVMGLMIFLGGVYQLVDNARFAGSTVGVEDVIPPWLFTGGIGVGYLLIEVGNIVASPAVRAPAILLLFLQPFLFWRLHQGLEEIQERVRALATPWAPPPPRDPTVTG